VTRVVVVLVLVCVRCEWSCGVDSSRHAATGRCQCSARDMQCIVQCLSRLSLCQAVHWTHRQRLRPRHLLARVPTQTLW